jgi:hypothetical protein
MHLPASIHQLALQLLVWNLPMLPRTTCCSLLQVMRLASRSHALQDTTVSGAISCSPNTIRRSNI